MTDIVYLVAGIIALIIAGDLLIKGAVHIALKLHLSPLVVGMTVVSFGTSAPELLVSIKAALSGHPDISVGNVVGSNIANLSLVLGLTAMVFPITIARNTIRYDWPVMMIATSLLILFSQDLQLERWEGALMVIMLLIFNTLIIIKSRKERKNQEIPAEALKHSLIKSITWIILGVLGLTYGADWLVTGASNIAIKLGVSERIVAVTMVAIGTSLPELMTSLVAAFKKQIDVSVGNLIGSNIFNIFSILGISSAIIPIHINEKLFHIDYWWMFALAVLLFPLMITHKKIGRIKGLILTLYYITYIIFLMIK